MDAQEFRNDFMESAKAAGLSTGDGTCASFVASFAEHLQNAEIMPDFTPAFYEGTGRRNKKMRVDGYCYNEYDQKFTLVIADFNGSTNDRTITKTHAELCMEKVRHFVEYAVEGGMDKAAEPSMPYSDLIDDLKRNKNEICKYQFLILTDAKMSTQLKELAASEVSGIPAETQVWDLDRLFAICASAAGREEIEIDFTDYCDKGLPCLTTNSSSSGGFTSYLCIIPGEMLADIYDKYGSALLESNVRSFLSTKVAVNKAIRFTIKEESDRFFVYNNGIAATARELKLVHDAGGSFIISARDVQIINGGQTTASLSNARFKDKADLSRIYVQMKLTEIVDKTDSEAAELVEKISQTSNSQNKVSDADFFASHPFHIRMEQISRRLFAPAASGRQFDTKWFYERARGQYLQAQMKMTTADKKKFQAKYPKEQLITKTDLAKVRNTWEMMPHLVSRGAQTNCNKFADEIKKEWKADDATFNEKYFKDTAALMILFRSTEQMVSKQDWYEGGYRANIVTYSIAMLRQLIKLHYKKYELDLDAIWRNQSVHPEVMSAVASIAKAIYAQITSSNRPVANVTQWCKREACWDGIRKLDIGLSEALLPHLISSADVMASERDAAADQVIASEADTQTKVIELKDVWLPLSDYCRDKRLSATDKELRALRDACQIPTKLPQPFQCDILLKLLRRAEEEGFKK